MAVFEIDTFQLMWSCGGVREICDSHHYGSKHRYERHQHHCRALRTSWDGLQVRGEGSGKITTLLVKSACELSLRCPWHMLASVWSSSVLSLVRQYMTCSTCSYEAQWGSFFGHHLGLKFGLPFFGLLFVPSGAGGSVTLLASVEAERGCDAPRGGSPGPGEGMRRL